MRSWWRRRLNLSRLITNLEKPPSKGFSPRGKVRLSVKYVVDAANSRTGSLEVTAAWLGSDTVSDIRRGENAGSRLHHPFVVLRTITIPLQPHEGTVTAVLQLPRIPRENSARLGIAVWVCREGSPVPEQATGGWWAP
jgi:hypothetical protein